MAKLVDARDSKSRGSDTVSVRVRPSAPFLARKRGFMAAPSCIFCKIIRQEIPSAIIKENQAAIAIKDISPRAPIHYLIIPKIHIESVAHMSDAEATVAAQMLILARDIAADAGITGFNLIANNGASAGQSVMHMHVHFLAGKDIYEHGLSL